MHAVHLNLFEDLHRRAPAVLLKEWSTLVDVAEAASAGGVRVSVVQTSAIEEQFELSGVQYHFVRGGSDANRGGFTALDELLRQLRPQVVHVHGLNWALQFRWLARLAEEMPVIAQDHANRCPRIWRRRLWRRGLAGLA